MLRKTLLLAVAFAVLTLSLSGPASAQVAKDVLITGGGGYTKLLDLELEKVNGIESGAENPTPDGSVVLSGAVFYTGTPHVAVGAEVAWLNFGTQEIDGTDDSYAAVPITGQVLYFVPMQKTQAEPFLTAGLGLYHLRNKEEGAVTIESTSNVFGFNLGVGLRMKTEMPVSFGVDVRYHMALMPDLTGDTPAGERSVETTDWNMICIMGKVFF